MILRVCAILWYEILGLGGLGVMCSSGDPLFAG